MARRRHPMNVRFAQIHSQLGSFLASRACLLRWLVTREEVPWVESALADGVRGVRVVSLGAPFEQPQAHGFLLGQELLAKVAHETGANGPWRVPSLAPGSSDVVVLARLAESFSQVCAARGERLVLELDPSALTDLRAYLRWMDRGLATLATTTVRLLVLEDPVERPLEPLVLRGPQVMTFRADLSIDAAVEELAERQDTSTVEGQIRVMLVRCMHLCRRGEVEAATGIARAAHALVADSGLFELGVPIQFAIGASWMARSRFPDAMRAYREAELAAERAIAGGRPQAAELRVFARLGVGSALIAGAALDRAAEHFEETARLAATLPNVRLEVESRRLASYCHERCGAQQKAWDAAFEGLAVVVRTPIEARPRDAARELGRSLVRLTQLRELRLYREGITAQLDKHLGRGWDAQPVQRA